MVEAFEGNRAETTTMLPTITAFMAAHELADVTVVGDAGMIFEGLSVVLGRRIPDIPYRGDRAARTHPDEPMPDGLILTQPRPAGPADKRGEEVAYYQTG